MTDPSDSSRPNVRSFGFQSTRNFVPVTAIATGPASKRQRALRVPRCAMATSARPDSISTRAPFDSVDSTRSRLPLSSTIELPSEKRSAVDAPSPASTTSPVRPGTPAAPASAPPAMRNEIGICNQSSTAAAAAIAAPTPTKIPRRPGNRDSPPPRIARAFRVVIVSTNRFRSARNSSAALPPSSSALRIFIPALISFASAGSISSLPLATAPAVAAL